MKEWRTGARAGAGATANDGRQRSCVMEARNYSHNASASQRWRTGWRWRQKYAGDIKRQMRATKRVAKLTRAVSDNEIMPMLAMHGILFDGIEKLYGRQAIKLLKESKVAIIGLGGVGSWCAEVCLSLHKRIISPILILCTLCSKVSSPISYSHYLIQQYWLL